MLKCAPRRAAELTKIEEIAMNMKDLKRTAGVRKASPRRDKVRFGRPPKKLAGEVEARILSAGGQRFQTKGLLHLTQPY